jgi:hypothetical protein
MTALSYHIVSMLSSRWTSLGSPTHGMRDARCARRSGGSRSTGRPPFVGTFGTTHDGEEAAVPVGAVELGGTVPVALAIGPAGIAAADGLTRAMAAALGLGEVVVSSPTNPEVHAPLPARAAAASASEAVRGQSVVAMKAPLLVVRVVFSCSFSFLKFELDVVARRAP